MRRVILAVVSTITGLVFLLGFKSHAVTSSATPPAAIGSRSLTAPAPSPSTAGSGGSTAAGSGGSTASQPATRSVTGDPADTRYGPVQVRITVTGGRLTAVTAVEYPVGSPRDQEINAYAIPALAQEVIAADSADVDLISGAMFTSEGYLQSLQSALDKAK